MTKPDAITREIIQNALAAAADEMSLALYRTAYSTIVRDCLDYSTSLCNGQGEMIAQGNTIPMHIGSVPTAMETLLKKFGGEMREGDVFVMNDPFDGGMHIPDIFIVQPIFWEGERVAFAVSTAHHLDLGGRLPGSSACDNTEIFQDGFRIPWLRLYDAGRPNETFFTLFRANIRVPHMTVGDVRAQLAACHIGERAIHELIGRYGVATFRDCAADLIDYTERLMRAEIATWPDGRYSFTDYLDSDGCGGPPVKFHVTLTVAGDSLSADFTGTDPQMRGAMNCTTSFVIAAVAVCVRCVMPQSVPNNAGIFRPLTIIAPPGTAVNAVMPAASSMRGVTGFRLVDTVFGALAQFLPDRVYAASEGGNTLVILGGNRPDRRSYVYYELLTGTWGAHPDRDGNDGLCSIANIASNIPIEQAECEYPVRIERYGLVRDSGGAGKFRGGLAVEREWTLLAGDAHLAIRSDRRDHPPYGLQGGHCGTPSTNVLRHSDRDEVLATMISTRMTERETIYHKQPGGGGFGKPYERLPESVAWDVKNDKVSLQAAREVYGVVLDPQTLEVDQAATVDLREDIDPMTRWHNIHELPTPVLLLDWPAAHRNIVKAASLVEGTGAKLRPHFKSHKCVPLAHEQLAGGNCCGLTAATVEEAAALVEGGIFDVLVANQIVVPSKVSRLVSLAKRGTIRVAVESSHNAKVLAAEAQRQGAQLGVLVEINVGHQRWGVAPGEQAVALAREVAAMPGLRFDGLQAYHGSGAHVPDAERPGYARSTMELAIATRRLIEESGLECPIVSGTGTGTFSAVLDMAGLTELQVGTYVLMDWAFQERTGDLFEIALTVLATVISATSDRLVLDVGLKGLGNRSGPPRFPDLTEYEVLQFAAEEHTIVRAPRHGLRVGERVRIMPSHACGTMNLYRQVVVHDGESIREIWPILATGYALPEGPEE